MLKFINKEGAKVMEMHDDGEVEVLNKKLKESFSKEKEASDSEEEQDSE